MTGTKVYVLSHHRWGDPGPLQEEDFRDGVIDIYNSLDAAQEAGTNYVDEYFEEELEGWSPSVETEEDRLKVEDEWRSSEYTDENEVWWYSRYISHHRGMKVGVEEWIVEGEVRVHDAGSREY